MGPQPSLLVQRVPARLQTRMESILSMILTPRRLKTQYGRVTVYKDGSYCPVTWDPVEGRWLRGPVMVFGEEQPDGASGGEDPMLREAAE